MKISYLPALIFMRPDNTMFLTHMVVKIILTCCKDKWLQEVHVETYRG